MFFYIFLKHFHSFLYIFKGFLYLFNHFVSKYIKKLIGCSAKQHQAHKNYFWISKAYNIWFVHSRQLHATLLYHLLHAFPCTQELFLDFEGVQHMVRSFEILNIILSTFHERLSISDGESSILLKARSLLSSP